MARDGIPAPVAHRAAPSNAAHSMAQPSLPTLQANLASTIAQFQKVVDLKGFTHALEQWAAAYVKLPPPPEDFDEHLLASPMYQLMCRISLLPEHERWGAQDALAEQINALGEIDYDYVVPTMESILELAATDEPEFSAGMGENFALNTAFHGITDPELLSSVREIMYEHALPEVVDGAIPHEVADQYGLYRQEDLERLEVAAATGDGVAGFAVYVGMSAQVAANTYGFRTKAGNLALQEIAIDELQGCSKLRETTDVQAIAAEHGIVEPRLVSQLEAEAVLGRAGRAAHSPGANIQQVAAAHGIVTLQGIESLEATVMERLIQPALLKGHSIPKTATILGITTPNSLLAMEQFAIKNLQSTIGNDFRKLDAKAIAQRIGIESQTGMHALELTLLQARLQALNAPASSGAPQVFDFLS